MCEVFGGGSPVSVLEKSSWILVVVLVKKKRKRKRNCWWLFGWRKWKWRLIKRVKGELFVSDGGLEFSSLSELR